MQTESTFKLISAETKPLTPEVVAEFAALKASPTERELDQKRIRYLKEHIEAGHATTFHWARAKLGEEVIRMNGQHSSAVLSELNGQMPAGLMAHIDTYEVSDRFGLALLFRQFDARISNRSKADIAGAYQMLELDLQDIPRGVAKLACEGVAWYDMAVEGLRRQGDDRYMLFHQNSLHPFFRWIADFFSLKSPELRRDAVLAAIYATWTKNPEAANAFWREVAQGSVAISEATAATILDDWLVEARERPDKSLKLKAANYYTACVYAWNATRRGTAIKAVKFDASKGLPEAIE